MIRKGLLALAGVLALASVANAYSFTQCGTHQCRWKNFPVGFVINEDLENLFPGAIAVARAAVVRWDHDRQTFCSVDFNDGGTTSVHESNADNESVVFAKTSGWEYTKDTLAVTQCFFDSNGYLLDCDVAVNAQDWEWDDHFAGDTVLNLRDTITHEAGHMWGLGHSDEQYATMSPYYSERIVAADLDEDDIRANADMYCDGDMPSDDELEPNDSLFLGRGPYDAIDLPSLRLYDVDVFKMQTADGTFPLIDIRDDEPERHKWVRLYTNERDLIGEARCVGDCLVAPTRSPVTAPISYVEIQTDFECSRVSSAPYSLRVTQVESVDESTLEDIGDDEGCGKESEEEKKDDGGACGTVSGGDPATGLPMLLFGLLGAAFMAGLRRSRAAERA